MTLEELWKAALGEIELSISRLNFKTWFSQTSLIDKEGDLVRISVSNHFVKSWLENKFNLIILRALKNVDPEVKKVEFQVKTPPEEARLKTKYPLSNKEVPSGLQMEFDILSVDKETGLNKKYNFSNFVVGSSNELAHAASTSITKALGAKYNPLFIYGGTGLGKTHLLQAIGNEVKTFYKSKKRVYYLNSEKFTNDLVRALRVQKTDEFKNKYREYDLLIIDDIQFIAGKARSQEELFHTFNALYENNKQIVFSSDRPPGLILDLEERLRSRFEGGMIADILPPDYEVRLAILRLKTQEKRLNLPPGILEIIASKIQRNIRELEGALNKVAAKFQQNNNNLSTQELDELLKSLTIEPFKMINPNKVIQVVANFYEIAEKELIDKTRKKDVVKPRQVAMYLLRDVLQFSFPSIGKKFGNRDHSTVIHACQKIDGEINKDSKFKKEVDTIKERVNSV